MATAAALAACQTPAGPATGLAPAPGQAFVLAMAEAGTGDAPAVARPDRLGDLPPAPTPTPTPTPVSGGAAGAATPASTSTPAPRGGGFVGGGGSGGGGSGGGGSGGGGSGGSGLAPPAPAPTPSPTPTPTPVPTSTPTPLAPLVDGPGAIAGLVLDPPHGNAPVAGATVRVTAVGDATREAIATTGPDGAYRVDGVALGTYEVRASKAGHVGADTPLMVTLYEAAPLRTGAHVVLVGP